MKNINILIKRLTVSIIFISLAFFSCTQPFSASNYPSPHKAVSADPFGNSSGTQKMGMVSLSVNDGNARTIMPSVSKADFVSVQIIFEPSENSDHNGKLAEFWVSGLQDATGDYLLAEGWYKNITVKAFYANETIPAAMGQSTDHFKISSEKPDTVPKVIVLELIDSTSFNNEGKFSWVIDDSANSIVPGGTAKMTITSRPGTNSYSEIINFNTANLTGVRTLESGIYDVSFEFGKTDFASVKFSEILYIAPLGKVSSYSYIIPKLASLSVKVSYFLDNEPVATDLTGPLQGGRFSIGAVIDKTSLPALSSSYNPAAIVSNPKAGIEGWYKDVGRTKKWNFSFDRVLSDTILYAKWTGSDITSSTTGMELKLIPPGDFQMGSPDDGTEPGRVKEVRNNEGILLYTYIDETRHWVTLTKSFYIGKYEVTQDQYQAVMGINPSNYTAAIPGENGTPGRLPVERVSWFDTVEFCNKLSIMDGLSPVYTITNKETRDNNGYLTIWAANVTVDWSKNGYRLPTEAEWEYACRAGTTTAYHTGPTISSSDAWFDMPWDKTHQVGLKTANAWGLYDMHGNVFEWCYDWFIQNQDYAPGPAVDPVLEWVNGAVWRSWRGGSWYWNANVMRSAFRDGHGPDHTNRANGFRVVRGL